MGVSEESGAPVLLLCLSCFVTCSDELGRWSACPCRVQAGGGIATLRTWIVNPSRDASSKRPRRAGPSLLANRAPRLPPRALLAAKNAIQRPSVALLTGKQGLSTPPALAAGYLFDLREPGQCAPGRERQLRSVSQAQRRRKGPRTVNSQRRAAALVSRDPQRPRPDPGIKKSSWATLVGPHTSGVVFCGLIREET